MSESNFVKNIADTISTQENQPVAVSALVLGDRIGYPRRIVSDSGETHDGEISGFDEAYDFASEIFGTTDIVVEKDEKYIWFTDNS